MDLQTQPDNYDDLLAQNNYLRQLLQAAVYGEMAENSDLTTMLYALRARAYIKYLEDSGDEEENFV